MQILQLEVLLIFLRLSIDGFTIYVFGFFVLGKLFPLRGLLLRALILGALTTAVRYALPNIGVASMLSFLLYIIVLAAGSSFSLFTVVSVVMLGKASYSILDMTFFYIFFEGLALFPRPANLVQGILFSIPVTAIIAVIPPVAGFILKRRLTAAPSDLLENREFSLPILNVASAQVVTLLILQLVFTTVSMHVRIVSSRTIYLSIFGLSFLIIYLIRKGEKGGIYPREEEGPGCGSRGRISGFLLHFFDLILFPPMIFLLLYLTGSEASLFKLVFIPYIITNALKRSLKYGITALVLSGAAIVLLHLQSSDYLVPLAIEADIIFFMVLVLVFFLFRAGLNYFDIEGYIRQFADSIGHPAVIVGRKGNPVYANASAESYRPGLEDIIASSLDMKKIDALLAKDPGDIVDIVLPRLELPVRVIPFRDQWSRPHGCLVILGNSGKANNSLQNPLYNLKERFSLSDREIELAGLIIGGYTNGEIADSLCISLSTVKSHTASIYRKMRINSRYSLMRLIGTPQGNSTAAVSSGPPPPEPAR